MGMRERIEAIYTQYRLLEHEKATRANLMVAFDAALAEAEKVEAEIKEARRIVLDNAALRAIQRNRDADYQRAMEAWGVTQHENFCIYTDSGHKFAGYAHDEANAILDAYFNPQPSLPEREGE